MCPKFFYTMDQFLFLFSFFMFPLSKSLKCDLFLEYFFFVSTIKWFDFCKNREIILQYSKISINFNYKPIIQNYRMIQMSQRENSLLGFFLRLLYISI